jgi:imidazolonepropionase-like amidohydrolase
MLIAEAVLQVAIHHPEQLNPSSAEKAKRVVPVMKKNLHDAYVSGVKIAFGTDQGLVPHGQNAKEFALMVGAGMKPIDAIWAATANAADLIGDSQDIGSVQKGRYADIVAVNGDPVADVHQLEHVAFVMKGGTVYKINNQVVPRQTGTK